MRKELWRERLADHKALARPGGDGPFDHHEIVLEHGSPAHVGHADFARREQNLDLFRIWPARKLAPVGKTRVEHLLAGFVIQDNPCAWPRVCAGRLFIKALSVAI